MLWPFQKWATKLFVAQKRYATKWATKDETAAQYVYRRQKKSSPYDVMGHEIRNRSTMFLWAAKILVAATLGHETWNCRPISARAAKFFAAQYCIWASKPGNVAQKRTPRTYFRRSTVCIVRRNGISPPKIWASTFERRTRDETIFVAHSIGRRKLRIGRRYCPSPKTNFLVVCMDPGWLSCSKTLFMGSS